MRKPRCTNAFLQLSSAAHHYWHRNLFVRHTFSNGTTLTRPCCFPQSPILCQQELAHAFPSSTTLTTPCCFPCRNYCMAELIDGQRVSTMLERRFHQSTASALLGPGPTWYMHRVCKTAQDKLVSPMTSMSKRESRKTLSVVVD